MKQRDGLSNIQRELLKMFNYDLPDSQMLEIKALLAKYFEEKVNLETDELWENRGWSDAQMETWSREHMRKKK